MGTSLSTCLPAHAIHHKGMACVTVPALLVKQFEASYAPLHKRKLATIQNDDVSPNKIDTN